MTIAQTLTDLWKFDTETETWTFRISGQWIPPQPPTNGGEVNSSMGGLARPINTTRSHPPQIFVRSQLVQCSKH